MKKFLVSLLLVTGCGFETPAPIIANTNGGIQQPSPRFHQGECLYFRNTFAVCRGCVVGISFSQRYFYNMDPVMCGFHHYRNLWIPEYELYRQ